ncbi:hypothetical protein B0I08_107200 [Glaciihabitans tibetensis]|uniref:WD40 repeat protein n=1 Tax=Glaciihabitans tibetensis TaxID=1266600 RepID=A0A2T0VAX2_9MICO|nr:hypothetical protein [Glaciihabitans tibetensis]PRY67304.1 hypothetical protein B0I08_107200 [Glaciihabitans tibetensis]
MTAIGLLVVALPYVWSAPHPGTAEPIFPSTVAAYDWWTSGLSASEMDAAIAMYRNGVGVEFFDAPQAVVLASDGSTYRRLGVSEELTIADDQGDPAPSVLSPDGTFVVVGNAGGGSEVTVATLRDNSQRSLDIGNGRAAVPVSIRADGKQVLLLVSTGSLSRYTDYTFRLHGALVSLNLDTGAVREYATLTDVNSAALSPDGARIVADTGDGIVLVDVADGSAQLLDVPVIDAPYIDGDAWSPNGQRLAFLSGNELHIVAVSEAQPVHRAIPLTGIEFGTAIGWRDDTSVLLHTSDDPEGNRSSFSWVDTESGDTERFSEYTPNFTGAALGSADFARDLVSVMVVADRPADRGFLPLGVNSALALALGFVVWAVSPRSSASPRN